MEQVDVLFWDFESLEARARIELANKGFADLCLTTWLPRPVENYSEDRLREKLCSWQTLARRRGFWKILERETGFEPATSTLARSHSTTELLPLDSSILDKAPCGVKPAPTLNLWILSTLMRGTTPLRVQLRLHNLAVAKMQNAIAESCCLRIVSNHQHGLTQFLV